MKNFKHPFIIVCLTILFIWLTTLTVEFHSLLKIDTPMFNVTLDSRP